MWLLIMFKYNYFPITALFIVVIAVSACSTIQTEYETQILGKNEHYIVVVAGEGETYSSLAKVFLGDPRQEWRIEDANAGALLRSGKHVLIPRTSPNPTGVFTNGYQTVPILSYHRFGAGRGKLSVTKRQFEEQMEYLKTNGYRVISLSQLLAFQKGKEAIPQRSVVLTIDDGYRSIYDIAFPVLKRYNFPATVFIYSDYIGKGGLSWRQMAEMESSGLISFQAHSKTHDNLTIRLATENMMGYKTRLVKEVRVPAELLGKRMNNPQVCYAYPFGDVNRLVVDELRRNGYEAGVTVDSGSNPFFRYPYILNRTMIYEKDGIREFKQALRVFQSRNLK
jgi:peptidoglycan/xylan/chitin deacetylase (PgdA/CDA1 family)